MAKGLISSSTQDLSNLCGNLTTSFQVKADLDLGKFSGMEPVPNNELTLDQWRVDVQSYQANVPDRILLPAIHKSITGKAQSVVRTLGPSYTVEDVIKCLAREYAGVTSSDIVFKEFYQLKQERGEKVQVFSIRLRDALADLSSRFLERVPREHHEGMLRNRFFYGIKTEMRNSIQHLYDDEKITFGELLQDVRTNLQGPMINASGPFANDQKPIQYFKCKGWWHPRRLCPSQLNYMRGGMTREPPSPARDEMTQPHPSNPNTQH